MGTPNKYYIIRVNIYIMNVYSTNHPIIPNNGEYIRYKKLVSIHSEDRNILKYPLSSQFEIELPEE